MNESLDDRYYNFFKIKIDLVTNHNFSIESFERLMELKWNQNLIFSINKKNLFKKSEL